MIEVYEVAAGADNQYAKGALKYMEIENYDGKRLKEKIYYNSDQTIKGKEIYTFEDKEILPSGSKYYDQDGALMSSYKFVYRDTLKTTARAFRGDSDELLRIEGFMYDNKGNMVSKTIYNELNQKQRTFLFSHDANGNDIRMVLLNEQDEQVLSESYEIVSITEDGEWLEKWGYRNDEAAPITFYFKRKSD